MVFTFGSFELRKGRMRKRKMKLQKEISVSDKLREGLIRGKIRRYQNVKHLG